MLQIDYSLIVLSDEDKKLVEREVARRLKAGEEPKIDKSMHGRLVVVNPDPVQTEHHLPDELRSPLRRITIDTLEGSLPIPAARLFESTKESSDPIYALVLEIQSAFRYLHDFLPYLAALKKLHPKMGLFIHGNTDNLLKQFQKVMERQDLTLLLAYPDARGTLEIDDPKEITLAQAEKVEIPSFNLPFFSQIKIKMPGQPQPVVMNLDNIRRLHPHYGVGEGREVEIGGGRKEKEYIIDLPLRMILAFQFRQDRGLDFHGAIKGDRIILSRDFEREKLELRWVPVASLTGLARKAPGKEMEKILFSEVRTIRINTFSGEVAFISRQASEQISFHDMTQVGFRFKPSFKEETPLPNSLKGDYAGKDIYFDHLVLTDNRFSAENIQKSLKSHYYGLIFRDDEEKKQKLNAYTKRLKVGGVGPLAGQTIKMLRRFGLEKLIDPKGFHYLADTPDQLPTYHLTPQRMDENFRLLVQSLRDVSIAHANHVRLDDIGHQMPMITEWIDTKVESLDQVKVSDLEAAYQEIKVLIDFINHEFRRNFNISEEDLSFFKAIKTCQDGALMAKRLADYKMGAYGPSLPQGEAPDFVFFGSPQDKANNDNHYFFPGLICSELFREPATRKLFEKNDYQFSVFLEEQLAMADHFAREKGGASHDLNSYNLYFDQKGARVAQVLAELREELAGFDSTSSPIYQSMLRKEEEDYHAKYKEFLTARETVGEKHMATEVNFQELLLKAKPVLMLPEQPLPDWIQGSGFNPQAFSKDIIAATEVTVEKKRARLNTQFSELATLVGEKSSPPGGYAQAMVEAFRLCWEYVKADLPRRELEAREKSHEAAPERLKALKKIGKKELETYLQRVESQRGYAQGEYSQWIPKMELFVGRNNQALTTLFHVVNRQTQQAKNLQKGHLGTPETRMAMIEQTSQRLQELAKSLQSNGQRLIGEMEKLEAMAAQRVRLAEGLEKLTVEVEICRGVMEGRAPILPPLDGQPEEATGQLEAFQTAKGRMKTGEAEMMGQTQALQLPDTLRQEVRGYQEFLQLTLQLKKLAARKERLRKAVSSIHQRMRMMDEEMADLPNRVETRFMPARKELLSRVFIPEAENDLAHFKAAKVFVRELLNLNQEFLQKIYLSRAVFKRFSSAQFIRGLAYFHDPQHPMGNRLTNFNPAIARFYRMMQHNYHHKHPQLSALLKLERHQPVSPPVLWDYIQQLAAKGVKAEYTYIILPGTLTLENAVKMMNQKDKLFRGIPMLVLIFVSKFDTEPLLKNQPMREAYFQALKHNIIINVDDRLLVDNPNAISGRLLQETLGSTFDTDEVDETMEDENKMKLKV